MLKIIFGLFLLAWSAKSFAIGVTIAMAIGGFATMGAMTAGYMALAMAINMVVATVVSRAFANKPSFDAGGGAAESPNPGNRQQLPPATDNKLPVVYGSAWVGGTIVDLSITENNQDLYYVLALAEVTNTNPGQTPDTYSFGAVYFGGKRVEFQPNGYVVAALIDESTNIRDTTVSGKISFYFYNNGSYSQTNQGLNAIQLMQSPGLVYLWNSTKLMTNTAFVIIKLTYSQTANVRGIEQTKFQITNSRSDAGDCFYDYLTNTRYGGAIPYNQIDVESLDQLTLYCNEEFTYQTYTGTVATQPRFKFNGVLDTKNNIMQNLQDMSTCCDCLVKYNEMQAKWGVIVQKPDNLIAMHIDDSNMTSAITITPMDIAASYNVIECKFPDEANQDAFNAANFDLSQIAPHLLYPNEPINKVSFSLPLCNNSIQAQYIANRILKAGREDLQVQVSVNFVGLQFDAGDIVTVSSVNYGWDNKLFRLNAVTQSFGEDGAIVCKLSMTEFNPSVYDDVPITQFSPAPNTGIGAPDFFGLMTAPLISNMQKGAAVPSFDVNVLTSQSGIIQYAEIWYSAFPNPTDLQRLFAGTTAVQSNGNPYLPNSMIPPATLSNIPYGNWYFFSRMVNSLASSSYSPPSVIVEWRPQTYQYSERYLSVAYADDELGNGFDFNPRGKFYFGLVNIAAANPVSDPAAYVWYPADPPFNQLLESYQVQGAIVGEAQNNYLLFTNRGSRRITMSIGNASYFTVGGSFVPTESGVYDQTTWSGLPDGLNIIDLDSRSGQLTKFGTSSVSQADGLLSVNNNTSGAMTVALQKFLNFGNGVYSKNFSTSSLTVDVFGRVVGFTDQDQFYFSEYTYTATAGQATFLCPNAQGTVLVYCDGVLLNPQEYSETDYDVTFNVPCAGGEVVYIMAMRVVASSNYYAELGIKTIMVDGQDVHYQGGLYQFVDPGMMVAFSNTPGATQYEVASIDPLTKTLTLIGAIPSGLAGTNIYVYRSASSNYAPFCRVTVAVNNINRVAPTEYTIRNGFEQLYVNGVQLNEIDYNIDNNIISGFPGPITGTMDFVVFTANNFGIPCSNITNTVTYSVTDQVVYPFKANPQSMEIYANGCNLVEGVGYDYVADSIAYSLLNTFPNNVTLLNQQTYARDGAV